ncbi:phage holin family protein [Amycolatopsis suaedae]|uniref:Phage holin family protein n=1 Tax=Amycolatopsis suaedae TaxID=2510978 RepID=A0A4Q7IYE1_9PSEU|nr:phage holin family protein [Amycolatopsis suaedae]RZQ59457.1 phage holin family protein [Amycolatopsis suaedae]
MTEQTANGTATGTDRSIAALVSDLSSQVSRLVRDELRLAVAEVRAKITRLTRGAGLSGFAVVLAFFGAATLVAAAVLGLATAMPAWAAALVVGGAFLVLAALFGAAGVSQVRKGAPPVPEEAAAGVRADLETIGESREKART